MWQEGTQDSLLAMRRKMREAIHRAFALKPDMCLLQSSDLVREKKVGPDWCRNIQHCGPLRQCKLHTCLATTIVLSPSGYCPKLSYTIRHVP